MLTRHWYERDSVAESLVHAAGAWKDPLRKQKLLFWTYELILSEEWEIVWGTLERVALRWGDSACVALLTGRQDAQDVLAFLTQLLALPTPPPYDPPSAGPLKSLPSQVPDVPTNWTVEQRTRLWLAVQDAIKHKHPLRLVRLLSALAPSCIALYLGQKQKVIGIYHMLELLGLPVLPTPCLVQWPQLTIGRLAARLFAIPRHLLPVTPLDPSGAATKEGCAFWRHIWATSDADSVWNEYFLDDLPDEWSTAEKVKSHH